MTRKRFFAINEDDLAKLVAVKRRLFTEDRLNGDDMRNLAQTLEAVERAATELPEKLSLPGVPHERQLALLRELAAVPDAFAAEMAARTGIPHRTVYVLLDQAEDLGWVSSQVEAPTLRGQAAGAAARRAYAMTEAGRTAIRRAEIGS